MNEFLDELLVFDYKLPPFQKTKWPRHYCPVLRSISIRKTHHSCNGLSRSTVPRILG